MHKSRFPDPMSTSAVLSWRVALTGTIATVLAAGATRLDYLDGMTGLIAVLSGIGFALLAVPLGIFAGVRIWNRGFGGARYAVAGVLLALALASPAALAGYLSLSYPPVQDVSTDLQDPPRFEVIGSLRGANANSVEFDPANAALQQKAYPGIRPLDVDMPLEDLNEMLTDYADDAGWRVLDFVPYKGPAKEGRMEAVARSLFLGLRDDIVIRVTNRQGRVRIDIRSAARYGHADFGGNARRVLAALEDMRQTARRTKR